MAFSGTLEKCKACDKTVYVVDMLSADGISYHKSCFKCSHCKGTLVMSNYSSMDGVLYCKPHFEQLFKETGSFSKNFQTNSRSAEKLNELTRAPSRVSSMFSGTQDKCATCHKTAYPLEKVTGNSSARNESGNDFYKMVLDIFEEPASMTYLLGNQFNSSSCLKDLWGRSNGSLIQIGWRTWEAKNTIVITEDWDNTGVQKITEDSMENANEESAFAESVIGIKDSAITAEIPSSMKKEEDINISDGGPVLVPGWVPTPTSTTEKGVTSNVVTEEIPTSMKKEENIIISEGGPVLVQF